MYIKSFLHFLCASQDRVADEKFMALNEIDEKIVSMTKTELAFLH